MHHSRLPAAILSAIATVVVVTAVRPFAQQSVSPNASAGRLTIDQLIDIKHPSAPMWSPDGRHIVFIWDRAGVSKVYVADSNGADQPRELPDAGAALNGAFWSRDGEALMIPKNGDLWRVRIDGSAATAVWTTPAFESNIVPSPDGSHVAFVRGGQGGRGGRGGQGGQGRQGGRGSGSGGSELLIRSLDDGRESLVVRSDDNPVGGVSWSPDGQSLLFTYGGSAIRHEQTPVYS